MLPQLVMYETVCIDIQHFLLWCGLVPSPVPFSFAYWKRQRAGQRAWNVRCSPHCWSFCLFTRQSRFSCSQVWVSHMNVKWQSLWNCAEHLHCRVRFMNTLIATRQTTTGSVVPNYISISCGSQQQLPEMSWEYYWACRDSFFKLLNSWKRIKRSNQKDGRITLGTWLLWP